jgi:SWI/SNF-related matrix-associated actin-dependent regulator of chromatin subfamily A3
VLYNSSMSTQQVRRNLPEVSRKRQSPEDDDEEEPDAGNPQEDEDEEEEEEEEEEDDDANLCHKWLAHCQCTIVGIRYYNGTAHAGEYVSLEREPDNPYDANAIRVDNLEGEKVGHIKATEAKVLARWMDRSERQSFSVEGTIPYGGNAYTMPVKIEFIMHAPQEKMAHRARRLNMQLKKDFARQFSFQSYLTDSDQNHAAAAEGPEVESKRMDWTRQAAELDELFEKQSSQQLCNLPAIPIPTELKTTLLDYQQDGLRWLVQQDTKPKLPFYSEKKEKGRKVWHCEITNASQTQKPEPFRGGILADEMVSLFEFISY